MKVAVTGGSGQLGTLVLSRLLDDGDVTSVVSVDLRPPVLASPKLTSVIGDIRDPDLARHFAGCEALVHMAFVVLQHKPPAEAHAINVEGSKNVFAAAARAGVRRIVYSSSIAAYGVVPGHPNPLDETAPRKRDPGFTYALSKYDVEEVLDAFEREHPDISVARLRPSILIGARIEHAPIASLLRRGYMADAGDVPFPIVWDEDVADAAMLALHRAAHGAYNLSADDHKTSAELARAAGMRLLRSTPASRRASVRALSKLVDWGVWHGFDPVWLDLGAAMWPSSERAKNELGWQPKYRTAVEVMQRWMADAPHRLDARLSLFFRLVGLALRRRAGTPADLRGVRARVRLVLTGPGGGEVGLVVDDGRVEVRGEAPRPPTSVVTMRADHFRDLIAGTTDEAALSASGGVKVDGDALALTLVATVARSFKDAVGGKVSKWMAATTP